MDLGGACYRFFWDEAKKYSLINYFFCCISEVSNHLLMIK
ncbi:Uncharacterized protein YP598_2197 [Yersinia pseudotuberculosis]|uniref:Uncharacterized protein n=1 Tax=Yersinia pseudotuberculosis serotype O:1b (strain IP 31758) TaxID=349747 RepID=A0A0U1QV47_YERP3|nr:hypothetical protein YpsIP31758_2146 [Yersinia pseudotuberculosis IP 31758]UFA61817.1 Uncharacterized protein YP598_2197 [Yersinia pseudotuberculosis]